MSNNISSISPAPEILGAIMSSEADIPGLRSNTKDYLLSRYNVDLPNVDVNIVTNNTDSVHLALPFYKGTKEAAKKIADQDVDNVSGGEIFGTIAVLVATGVLLGGVVIGGACFGAASQKDNK